tara:strand:+ start:858 stop:1007 length:150 start_codon:yes stop_codon:yes gene_type:complete
MIEEIKNIVIALPPLLQLLIGIFTTIGAIRLFMFVVDLIEDLREGKHKN